MGQNEVAEGDGFMLALGREDLRKGVGLGRLNEGFWGLVGDIRRRGGVVWIRGVGSYVGYRGKMWNEQNRMGCRRESGVSYAWCREGPQGLVESVIQVVNPFLGFSGVGLRKDRGRFRRGLNGGVSGMWQG